MAYGWTDAAMFVENVAALAERLAAEETLWAIDSAWPRWTHWSAANNRVSDDPGDFILDPPVRPSEQNALAGISQEVMAANMELLARHETPSPIYIGNAVPYARDVGWVENNGAMIYEEAGRFSAGVAAQRVQVEWMRLKL